MGIVRSALFLALVVSLLISSLPGCAPRRAAENYIAVVPKTLHAGAAGSVSVVLLRGDAPVSGRVDATLLKDGRTVTKAGADIKGRGTVTLRVPDVEEGLYEIRVKGNGFETSAPVKVERSLLLFLQTDKPIYKPGQTIYMRAISLEGQLKPVSDLVTVEVLDAKGIKVFRAEVVTDEYGMADLELPLSTEPNLGVWKVSASAARTKTQVDVRVEEYVLPKYEVKADLARDWFLVNEKIRGTVSAEYSFGRAVSGELEVKATKYVGTWEEYAAVSKAIDGNADFEIPAAGYVAGVPGAGGAGNVVLDITVREKATGYEERTSRLLTVAQAETHLQIIPESSAFKPGLPFGLLLVSETPGNTPVDASAKVTVTYLDREYREAGQHEESANTVKGKAVVEIMPPQDAVALVVEAWTTGQQLSNLATATVTASYSPSGNFIHIEQTSQGIPRTGDKIRFKVYSTRKASNFYYEVVSRGRVVFSDFTRSSEIEVDATPVMSPSSRLVVYQILPNSEVAADYLPFEVQAVFPHSVSAEFSKPQARPGDKVSVDIRTEGAAKVGLAAVDRSVYILAENRVNLAQVFEALERLYMRPQAELHDVSIYPEIRTKGARQIFDEAGVTVLTKGNVPDGKDYQFRGRSGVWDKIFRFLNGRGILAEAEKGLPPPVAIGMAPGASQATSDTSTAGLAEVQRVRQFFPETWLWDSRIIGPNGRASLQVEVPDTITTWMLQAVAISKEKGLGIAEDQLEAFQPFFLTVDLPYSAIRGEEFPVRVAIYNYLNEPQSVLVQVEPAPWFDLLDQTQKTVEIGANDIGSAVFVVRPKRLGTNAVRIVARSKQAADAVVKNIIIDPEGVAREEVQNMVLSGGTSRVIDAALPPMIVDGSGRVYLTLTSSYLTQTIEGLEGLLQMPFGCGEQNMILLAPNVFITKYLTESGQLKPEVMAKAEKLMITGYQRELTYRRSDGSFSAFGESDKEGSLWLTAFVLKTFAQARDLIYVDDSVLDTAAAWITAHQNGDGSFDAVGFVHHQEMIGGVSGKTALTAYVATALMEAGESASSTKAVAYLEKQLDSIKDAYTMAIVAYALERAGSGMRDRAYDRLMAMAKEDGDGLHWGDSPAVEPARNGVGEPGRRIPMPRPQTVEIEATAYATLALTTRGDAFNSSRAAKWLVSRRNAFGGYGSTQDTVVTLQALTEQATGARADVDLTVTLKAGDFEKRIRITRQNFDVLQVAEITPGQQVEVSAVGTGEVIGQVVKRFNVPAAEREPEQILKVEVDYDATQVEVDDLVNVSVRVAFSPPQPMEAGMVVVDISVPTGFAPVTATIAQAVQRESRIKRYDVAGRKVIFYIENMRPGEAISFGFQVKAMYPVKAKGVTSEAYSYYKPEIRAEALSKDMTVR